MSVTFACLEFTALSRCLLAVCLANERSAVAWCSASVLEALHAAECPLLCLKLVPRLSARVSHSRQSGGGWFSICSAAELKPRVCISLRGLRVCVSGFLGVSLKGDLMR